MQTVQREIQDYIGLRGRTEPPQTGLTIDSTDVAFVAKVGYLQFLLFAYFMSNIHDALRPPVVRNMQLS